ncbi:piercer of microtubule wall 2 protein [Amia ocellicauda]|uniref:piercer of microtubule wall 2 protein n=1 Tax=Amia ocellicauda TaxID=2972642 RepID=UPI003464A1CB
MSGTVGYASGRVDSSHACANLGNPVFSCMIKPGTPSTSSVSLGRHQNLLYKTTSSEYGVISPTFETAPCTYHPMSQKFSQHLGNCGMYRNSSFNTSLDRSNVYDCPNLQNTL